MCLLTSCSLNSDVLGYNSVILKYKLLPAIHLTKYILKKEKSSSFLIRIRRKKYVEVLLTVGFAKSSLNTLFICSNHFRTNYKLCLNFTES